MGRLVRVKPHLLAALSVAALVACGCAAGRRAADHVAPAATPTAPVPSASPPAPTATPLPGPAAPLPPGPRRFAAALAATRAALYREIDRWRASGDPAHGGPPEAVTLLALYEQRAYLRLAADRRLAAAVVPRLPRGARVEARDVLAAEHALAILNRATRERRFRTGPAEPAAALLAHYREGQRRSGVPWPLLAAVNFIESDFGRLRNDSTAGAQGPMQFIPSTWRSYGDGGDVHDPRAAILAAARFLRAAGAARSEARALYAYNPSPLYVTAVARYARRIRRDPRAFYALYSWQVYVRTPHGVRRLTGPGLTG